jgi:DNA polymerase III subunit epsilon
VAQAAFPEQAEFSLEALSQLLGVVSETQQICPQLNFHDAWFDAVATLLVLREIITRAELQEAPLEVLVAPERSAYFTRRRFKV